jgi:hypothetical protein
MGFYVSWLGAHPEPTHGEFLMAVTQRGKVTAREERGFGPVSFKRMLMSGGAGLIGTMAAGKAFGPLGSCIGGAVLFALVIILSAPREGMPMLFYLLHSLRGLLITAEDPDRIQQTLAGLLLARPEEGVIHSEDLFLHQADETARDLEDSWTMLGKDPHEEGLVVLSAPVVSSAIIRDTAGGD